MESTHKANKDRVQSVDLHLEEGEGQKQEEIIIRNKNHLSRKIDIGMPPKACQKQ